MAHVVLLGDSIFDNAAYIGTSPAVIDRLRDVLPKGDRATLLAVDGHMTYQVHDQLRRVPDDATHVVVSAGGNNALSATDVLSRRASTVAHALAQIAEKASVFERSYRAMLDDVLKLKRRTCVCSVYFPRFEDASLQASAVAGLTFYNDAILRVAFERNVDVVDPRLLANEPSDYANEIEPSSHGGAKIARASTRFVAAASSERSRVFV